MRHKTQENATNLNISTLQFLEVVHLGVMDTVVDYIVENSTGYPAVKQF